MRFASKRTPAQTGQAPGTGQEAPDLEQHLRALVAEAHAVKQRLRDSEARHLELEDAVGDALAKAELMAGELVRAERRTEEARRETKPRAARRIAHLERELETARQALVEAKAEAEQERTERVRLQAQIESVTRSEGEARGAAERERARLLVMEQQLRDLVGPDGSGAASAKVPPVLETLGAAESRSAEAREVARSAEQPAQPAAPAKSRSRSGRRRRRRRSGQQPANCAVCGKVPTAAGSDAFADGGWVMAGKAGLCPDCQEKGWQLPATGGLPHRRIESTESSA